MKLTPARSVTDEPQHRQAAAAALTQRLNVVLVKRAFDVLDHERRLANLRVADHGDFHDN
jgi:hypothetical protein